MGTLKRAGQSLKGAVIDSEAPRKKQKVSNTTREDFSVLVVAIVTLSVSLWKADPRVKPDSNEIDLFSNHVSGILLRHLPIDNKLSADALDVIGIFAVVSGWASRVYIFQQQTQTVDATQPRAAGTRTTETKANQGPFNPVQEIDPATFDAMNRVAGQAAMRGA